MTTGRGGGPGPQVGNAAGAATRIHTAQRCGDVGRNPIVINDAVGSAGRNRQSDPEGAEAKRSPGGEKGGPTLIGLIISIHAKAH
jgi:hypothetical protein